MAVRIRMKQMGRAHRHFFRIVAIESRNPRDGRALEELGTYNPHAHTEEAEVFLKPSRIKHWISVGAKPSEKVAALMAKHMERFEKQEAEAAAAAEQPQGDTAAPEETQTEQAEQPTTEEQTPSS